MVKARRRLQVRSHARLGGASPGDAREKRRRARIQNRCVPAHGELSCGSRRRSRGRGAGRRTASPEPRRASAACRLHARCAGGRPADAQPRAGAASSQTAAHTLGVGPRPFESPTAIPGSAARGRALRELPPAPGGAPVVAWLATTSESSNCRDLKASSHPYEPPRSVRWRRRRWIPTRLRQRCGPFAAAMARRRRRCSPTRTRFTSPAAQMQAAARDAAGLAAALARPFAGLGTGSDFEGKRVPRRRRRAPSSSRSDRARGTSRHGERSGAPMAHKAVLSWRRRRGRTIGGVVKVLNQRVEEVSRATRGDVLISEPLGIALVNERMRASVHCGARRASRRSSRAARCSRTAA